MTHQEEAAVTDRLRRALLAFQSVQRLLLAAERKLKGLPAEEIEAFWAAPGGCIERHVVSAARQVIEAFAAFSATGLVASAADRHLVTEAKRYLAETKV
jgi:phosphoserine phosphatase